MKFFMMPVMGASAIAVVALGLADAAGAAPSGPTTVSETLSTLQAKGFHVILNKVGAAPLEQCAINSVRPGQTFERMDSGVPGAMDDIATTVTARTVYVDVVC